MLSLQLSVFVFFLLCVCRIVHLHMDELGFISQWRAIFAGGLAGVAAALVTYPLEVAETRLIVQNCREPTYVGVIHTLSKISRSEGLLALYRGFSLTVLGVYAYSYECVNVKISNMNAVKRSSALKKKKKKVLMRPYELTVKF